MTGVWRRWLTILLVVLAVIALAATVDLINGTYVYADCPQGMTIPPDTACRVGGSTVD